MALVRIACCDIVGGDSRKYAVWLALPEFLHVGSSIVDDVQDKSTIRRGVDDSHDLRRRDSNQCRHLLLLHGTGAARAGRCHRGDPVRLYNLYFEALRAGHAGQAFDIEGLASIMPDAVERGDSAGVEKRLLAIHNLKTAAPAGALARMGAVAGGRKKADRRARPLLLRGGAAFQVMDDVLNLRVPERLEAARRGHLSREGDECRSPRRSH